VKITRQIFITRVTPEHILTTHDISPTTAIFSSMGAE